MEESVRNSMSIKNVSRIIVAAATVLAIALSAGVTADRHAGRTPAALGTYVLEDATERQRLERMLSVTLYRDGTARLQTPPISSYLLLDPYFYTFTDSELLIHYERDDVIARFALDGDALVFREASVPLYADEGARYALPGRSAFSGTPRSWLDYHPGGHMPWDDSLELELPEFPGTVFRWTPSAVTAAGPDGEQTLYSGMPVWNVFLADLTGDGLPELCSTLSIGSGMIDDRVVAYDCAAGRLYELSDRMKYDYTLHLDGERLMVLRRPAMAHEAGPEATGELVIVNGELTGTGFDGAAT